MADVVGRREMSKVVALVATTPTELLPETATYLPGPAPPAKVTVAWLLQESNATALGVATIGVPASTDPRLLDAVTVTVAPLLSTTAICCDTTHCPFAVMVNRPPLAVTTDVLMLKVPG